MAVREDVLEKIKELTTEPGVYLWKDEKGRIIYVGKAVNLRNRVKSYVRKDSNRAVKVAAMMSHAVDLETIVVANEAEALILENTLIKSIIRVITLCCVMIRPIPILKVTLNEEYPRVFMTRRVLRDGARYFGPFCRCGGGSSRSEINADSLAFADVSFHEGGTAVFCSIIWDIARLPV